MQEIIASAVAVIDGFKALVVMLVNGFFSGIGAAFSYFYHVDKKEIKVSRKAFFLWVGLGWGVGMVAGGFIEHAPDYVAEQSYGALVLIGMFWRQVWDKMSIKATRLVD